MERLCYYKDMKKNILAPSLLSADFISLKDSFSIIENNGGSWVHIDVMDGVFVPEITFGQPVVKQLRKLTKLPFDVHLMTVHPENQIESFAECGADYITFHYEAAIHHHRIVQQIHALGKKAGISIVPSTPVSVIKELLPFVDLVLVMSVNPGFGGQKLIPETLKKVSELRNYKQENNSSFLISVDGGVNKNTVNMVIEAGADVLVSGSAFFSGDLQWEKL